MSRFFVFTLSLLISLTSFSQTSHDFILKGLQYFAENNYKAASESFTKALELDPTAYEAWFKRGQANLEQGKLNEAHLDFSKVIELMPNHGEAYFYRALTGIRRGMESDALKDLNRALEVDTTLVEAYLLRAEIGFKAGQNGSVMNDLNRAAGLAPGNPNVFHLRSKYLIRQGKEKEALEDLSKAVSLDPANPDIRLERSQLCIEQGLFTDAIEDLSVAIENGCNYAHIYQLRADAYTQAEMPGQAIADYTMLINTFSLRTDLNYFQRGILRIQTNDLRGACEDLRKASSLGHPEASKKAAEICR